MSAMDDVLGALATPAPTTILTRPATPDTQPAPVYKRPARELFAKPAPAPALKTPARRGYKLEAFDFQIGAADDARPGAGQIVVWPFGYARLDPVPVNEAAPNAYADERRRGAELRTPLHWAKVGTKRDGSATLPKLRTSFPYQDAGQSRTFADALADLGKVIARTDREAYPRGGQTSTQRYAGRRLFPGWQIVATNGHVAQVRMCEDRAEDTKPLQADPGWHAVGWMLGPSWQAYAHVRAAAEPDGHGARWITLTWAPATDAKTLGRPDRERFDTFSAYAQDTEGTHARSWATVELHPDVAGPVTLRLDDKYLWPFRGTFVTVWAAGEWSGNQKRPHGEHGMVMLTEGQDGVVIMGAKS